MDRKGTSQNLTTHAQGMQFNSKEDAEPLLQIAAHIMADSLRTIQGNLDLVVAILKDIDSGKVRKRNK